ncbi:MAG: RNA polymerase sigma factor [Clostridiales bacterium]|nr:RNA polymerase sigma factor [Clostridiales bacterium]
MSIETLIERTASKDKVAFEKLYNKCFKLVYSVAYSITRRGVDAEDVAADVFVTLWNKAESYRGGSGKSFLITITKNHALTFIKRRERENTAITEDLNAGSYGIEDNAHNRLTVENALNVLSDVERETVLLHNSGMKHREIANLTGESLGTVTWRYNNALKKMRTFLQGGNNEK